MSSADLTIAYDAATGDLWTARATLAGLTQSDLSIDVATFSGSGQLRAGVEGSAPLIDGAVRLDAKNILPTRPELAAAIGSDLTGALQFNWQSDDVLAISNLTLAGEDYDLTGDVTLSEFADGVVARSDTLRLSAGDLSRFSGLAGAQLSGHVTLNMTGESNLLGGAFDLRLDGRGAGLGVNQPQLDAVIGGESTLWRCVRCVTQTGTQIEGLELKTEKALLTASADLTSRESTLPTSRCSCPMPAPSTRQLRGPAHLTASVLQIGTDMRVQTDFTGPGEATLNGTTLVRFADGVPEQIDGTLRGDIVQLAPYSGLAQRPLSGGLQFDVGGQLRPESGDFTIELDATGVSLGTGIAQADALLRGESTLSLAAQRTGDAPVSLDHLTLRSDALTLTANGARRRIKEPVSHSSRA